MYQKPFCQMKCQYLQWFGRGNQDSCKLSHNAPALRGLLNLQKLKSTVFAWELDQNFFMVLIAIYSDFTRHFLSFFLDDTHKIVIFAWRNESKIWKKWHVVNNLWPRMTYSIKVAVTTICRLILEKLSRIFFFSFLQSVSYFC